MFEDPHASEDGRRPGAIGGNLEHAGLREDTAAWGAFREWNAPHLDAVADEMNGEIKVAKINVDDNPMAASKYGIRGLPTLMIFKDGKVTATHPGAMSKQKITEWIKENT